LGQAGIDGRMLLDEFEDVMAVTKKISFFRAGKLCSSETALMFRGAIPPQSSGLKCKARNKSAEHLVIRPEDGGEIFILNVEICRDFRAIQHKRPNS
jgi:hypothetical protein